MKRRTGKLDRVSLCTPCPVTLLLFALALGSVSGTAAGGPMLFPHRTGGRW